MFTGIYSNMSLRNFCYTLNNYTPEEYDNIKKVECRYHICAKEVGTSGTAHLQGYIEFDKAYRLNAVKKLFGTPRIHIEGKKGTSAQASDYCRKSDPEPFECGKLGGNQGMRTDIIKMSTQPGAKLRDIALEASYVGLRHAEKILSLHETKRNWPVTVVWFHGRTGTGKTRAAMQICKDPWISGRDLKWWQGYDAHEEIILDDFRADFCKFHELLRILDRYPYTVEVKGGSRQLLSKIIIITSCYAPEEVYCGQTTEHLDQLKRRINLIVNFSDTNSINIECLVEKVRKLQEENEQVEKQTSKVELENAP